MSIWTKPFPSPLVHIWLVVTTRRLGRSSSKPRLWKWWESHAKKRPDFPTHSHSHYYELTSLMRKTKPDTSLAIKTRHFNLLTTPTKANAAGGEARGVLSQDDIF